ncbi:hypothetical protein [Marilutibacter aestuarii]|uniref:Uncharacterized protein n=1 Tax=Marilutibacter aestuarii TaxID=1706195 RepID=A0A508AHR4_9GAMM|nr:hypothetical protein [Lysobacter aestuarii]TQD49710.1 hypothetical protein FKV25_04095 [Lysobacter aestuarii]
MPQDLLDITLSDEQIAAADAAFEQLVRALPGLTALTPEEHQEMRAAAANAGTRELRALAAMEPPAGGDAGLDALRRDMQAYDRLHSVFERVHALRAMLDDTIAALGGRMARSALSARAAGDRGPDSDPSGGR